MGRKDGWYKGPVVTWYIDLISGACYVGMISRTKVNRAWYIGMISGTWYIGMISRAWYIGIISGAWYIGMISGSWYIGMISETWLISGNDRVI